MQDKNRPHWFMDVKWLIMNTCLQDQLYTENIFVASIIVTYAKYVFMYIIRNKGW